MNTSNQFAEKFPLISLEFSNQPKIEVRPAISLPRVPLPSLEFGIQTEIKEFFSFKKIQPKPEAPWLNRIKGSIQFTESIVDVGTEPTELSEREDKRYRLETEEEIEEKKKRGIKSMIPLRHFSSEAHRHLPKISENLDTPHEIVKKIQELCNRKIT